MRRFLDNLLIYSIMAEKVTQNETQVIWKGVVQERKGMMARRRYCEIYENRFVLREKQNPNSKILLDITPQDLAEEITLPNFSMFEAMIVGYKGFSLKYSKGRKVKDLRFWGSKGYCRGHPNKEKMEQIAKALAEFSNQDYEKIMNNDQTPSAIIYILAVLSAVVGFLIGGLVGAFIMTGFAFLASLIWKRDDLSETLKIATNIGIMVVGLIVTGLLSMIISVLLIQLGA